MVRVGILISFQILTERLSVFMVEYYVDCESVINSFYYAAVYTLCPHFGKRFFFIISGYWILSNAFSVSIEMIMRLSSFLLLILYITFIDLQMLNHPCVPGINPTWSWCMILFKYSWIQFVNILLGIFASMFIKDIGLSFSLLVVSLPSFGNKVMVASQNDFESVPSSLVFRRAWEGSV